MNNPIEGLEGLPDAQKNALMTQIEEMQVRDSLRMYNNVVERCFRDCVESFRRKDLDSSEERCVTRCCEKFMKHSARVGMRFGELSSQAEQQMQQVMQNQTGK
ncbi:protein transporter tim9 [Trebouxia sp. C0009 RCD-2024]